MIHFTADLHFDHANIAGPKTSKWGDGYRDFKSVEDMNETLILNINNQVKWDDTLYFLGDWCFKDHKNTPHWRNRIHCQTIHWMLGNHDPHAHLYRGSFTSVQHYLEATEEGRKFILFHYSMRAWHGANKGNYHLYGHSHSNLEHIPLGKSMDVGVDNAYKILGAYRPFTLPEVVSILDKREIAALDHHSPKAVR